jgi:hypothetical protein
MNKKLLKNKQPDLINSVISSDLRTPIMTKTGVSISPIEYSNIFNIY